MKFYTVFIQHDFEGNNIEEKTMQVNTIEKRHYGYHGYVNWKGLSYGVYSRDGIVWSLDLW